MKLIIAFILILCTSCSNNTKVDSDQQSEKPDSTPNSGLIDKQNEENDNSTKVDEIQFNYKVEIDPIEFRQTHSEIIIEKVQKNVFKGQYDYIDSYYVNLNTYSEIRLVEDGDKNYYSEILNFKDASCTIGNCVYSFKDGLNHHSDCEKFWFFEDDKTAYITTLDRFNEFLRSYNQEYFENSVKYLLADNSYQMEDYDEIFTQEVIENCLNALVEYVDQNYDLDPSIQNDVFSEELIREYIAKISK